MARDFEFTDIVKRAAAQRQMNRCALCGKAVKNLPLSEQQRENGQIKGHGTLDFHHVWPNQVGRVTRGGDQWIKTDINCVMLCQPCHKESHENGNTRTGAVLHPSEFKYSHGGNTRKHAQWLAELKAKIGLV